VLGTINLCEASRQAGVRRVVFAACSGRHGTSICVPAGENSVVSPLSPYAAAKLAGEMYLRAYAAMYDLAPICLALTNVYGPRQRPQGPTALIAVLGVAMITGNPFTAYRDSSAASDYVYVDDVVEAFVRAGRAPLGTACTYTIGTGRHTMVTEVHRLICAVLGEPLAVSPTSSRDRWLNVPALEVSEAEKELGWKPAVDLAEGIERTVTWLCTTLEPEPPALVGA